MQSTRLMPGLARESPNVSLNKKLSLLPLTSKLKGSLGKYIVHYNPKYPFLIHEEEIKEQWALVQHESPDLGAEIGVLNELRGVVDSKRSFHISLEGEVKEKRILSEKLEQTF